MADSDLSDVAELDETILALDAPDDTLERATGVDEGKITTWVYCTQGWYNCGWPL